MLDFKFREDCNYKYNYKQIFSDIASGKLDEVATFRELIKNDLFFIVYFVMEIPPANHPFVVDSSRLIEDGPNSNTLDIWAREHFKSTIITIGETIKEIVNDPEKTHAIFSFRKSAAEQFLDAIRQTLKKPIMIKCFPEILYDNPDTQAHRWSLQNGIVVKRRSVSRKEATVAAFGLVEGMPTGGHYDRRIYDDIETADLAKNPDQLEKCFSQFEMSDFLGTNGGTKRVVGTFYHHAGPLVRVMEKERISGGLMFNSRIIPGSDDGTPTGKPIFVNDDRWEELQVGQHFNQQILCDPKPSVDRSLEAEYLTAIEPEFIPPDIMKFMLIDPAGDQATQKGTDSWAMGVFGVQPAMDDLGISNIYILDLEIKPRTHTEAIEAAVRMYMRNGMIMKLGIEKVGQSTAEIHIANALASNHRHVSLESGTLELLKPAGRNKIDRIVEAFQWPLMNNKWHYSTNVAKHNIQRLKEEMDKFPVWHDDGLDICAYLYDVIKNYHFTNNIAFANKKLPRRNMGVV